MFSFRRRPVAEESDSEGQPNTAAEAALAERGGSEGGEGDGSSDDDDSGSEQSTEGEGEGESTSEDSDDNPFTRDLSPPIEITYHHEEDDEGEDFLDEDGLSESGDDESRRPVSIQEFLAWRLLGRVPDAARSRNETRSRYAAIY